MFDLLIFIGRFQPFHNGHLAVIRKGLQEAKHVLVLVGSTNRAKSVRDPFSFDERATMIRLSLPDVAHRLIIEPLPDSLYNDHAWLRNVHYTVDVVATRMDLGPTAQIGLIGHSKDHSSYYLKLFPDWGGIAVANFAGINATQIRKILFELPVHTAGEIQAQLLGLRAVPDAVGTWLAHYCLSESYRHLRQEADFVADYKRQFSGYKYPPTFNTADAVVVQAGHILLVQRAASPGKGLWALPGGFIGQTETALAAAIRELREETKLKVPEPVLYGSLKQQFSFDDPHRSVRGRTFTTAFYFDLVAQLALPKVKGGDDAAAAFWLPLSRLRCEDLFEDHFFIVQKFLGF